MKLHTSIMDSGRPSLFGKWTTCIF